LQVLQLVAGKSVQPLDVGSVHCSALHITARQDEVKLQVTPQAHDGPQAMLVHEFRPAQSTLHGPAPHVTPWQLREPLHTIVHPLLLAQLMPLLHALSPEHAMLQLQPVGHVICRVHASGLSAQSTVQVFVAVLHDVHCDGQLPVGGASVFTPESSAGPTQNPSLQVRPSAQSACFSHAKSPLRWLTEQPPEVTTANPRTANQNATSFTAYLRS